MKKTLICFVTTLILIISVLPVGAGNLNINSEAVSGEYESAISTLKTLGIAEKIRDNSDSLVTRAEFADLVIKAVNMKPAYFEPLFTDVTDVSPYAGSVIAAAHIGIIDGNGKGKFNPDEPIELYAAIKMSVAALGYNDIAWLNGGYPYGYLKIADELDMTDNISLEKSLLSFADACVLIANMLKSDMCVVTSISTNSIAGQRQYGVCPLTEYFHFDKIEGIVKTAGFASIFPDNNADKEEFVIGSRRFDCNVEDDAKFLGHNVTAWYDENETIQLIYVNSGYSSVIINGSEIEDYENYTISLYDAERDKVGRYSLSRSYTFVKNGRGYANSDEDFLVGYGSFELIDSDGDRKFDVVKANIPQYMVVSSKDLHSQTIYDNGGTSLVLKNED